MALLSANRLTLAELATRVGDTGVQTVAEVLSETNDVLIDAVWIEGNQPAGHKANVRRSLPTGTWRHINGGVTEESSKVDSVLEGTGILESLSKVDVDLASMARNPQEFRAMEDEAFVEGMGQEFVETLIYGNRDTDPNEFTGLAPRLNDLSYGNVVSASGSGSDLTSVYIVQWGLKMAHMIYPQGSQIGLEMTDLGKILTEADDDSGEFMAWVTNFKMKPGFFVHDPRCIGRLCNIETSGTSNIFDDDLLIKMLRKLPYNGRGAVLLANSTVLAQVDILAKDKSNVNYSVSDAFGVPTTTFRGIPFRQVDAILDTETAIS